MAIRMRFLGLAALGWAVGAWWMRLKIPCPFNAELISLPLYSLLSFGLIYFIPSMYCFVQKRIVE